MDWRILLRKVRKGTNYIKKKTSADKSKNYFDHSAVRANHRRVSHMVCSVTVNNFVRQCYKIQQGRRPIGIISLYQSRKRMSSPGVHQVILSVSTDERRKFQRHSRATSKPRRNVIGRSAWSDIGPHPVADKWQARIHAGQSANVSRAYTQIYLLNYLYITNLVLCYDIL